MELEEGEVLVAVSDNVIVSKVNTNVEIQNSTLQLSEVVENQEVSDKVIPQVTQSDGDGWSLVSPGKGSGSFGFQRGGSEELGTGDGENRGAESQSSSFLEELP
ncbi:unnamed protein product [Arabidopsis thaliana]|uniref:(thale cress) hypothetical protein n=1 Tax=Arabidopsis thaliana TaxID=3702 RepID=A0A7G2EA04_ARATH|nr:unnamed protein product [Arabidopsis thaliana]